MLQPTVFVIFGITGDLSGRYILPALTTLKKARQLPADFKIVGISRREISASEVLSKGTKTLESNLELVKVDMSRLADYRQLKKKIQTISKGFKKKPRIIFYLLIPPETVPETIGMLGRSSLNGPNVTLLLEKPFGTDLKSASKLINETQRHFKESQIYRIDHYLAKEVAQNIIVFLGSNALFRRVWDNRFIEKIQIVAAENIGIVGRSSFYEQTGALRDFTQSHLMQLAALILMEPNNDPFDLHQVAARRLAALKELKPFARQSRKDLVAGQYQGYAKEADNLESDTETFVALTLYSRSRRWKKVPIQLITGKKLDQKLTEIRVFFKRTHASQSNLLILRIQPREGIELDMWVKEPGYERRLKNLSHRLDYDQHFGKLPEAYEQVLVDALRGSPGVFASSGEVLASWKTLQPLLDHWRKHGKDLVIYKPGSSVEAVLGGKSK